MPKSMRWGAVLLTLLLVVTFTVPASAAGELYYGSTGEKVRQVQQKLKNWGYYSGSVDGVYGAGTYQAVVSFQKKNGLTADGVVGAATAAAMGITLTSAASSGSYSNEVYLLARAVYGEARGEAYTGQVAVAAVILNRVASPSFPNTIAGVIYQKGAFTCVSDGQINLTPDNSALNAARDAMNGWDLSGGALYYYNPAKTTSAWIYSRTVITVIGRHYFAI